MAFKLTIETENAAFYNPDGDHDPCAEVASILESLCLHLRSGADHGTKLYDTNGNVVGRWEFKRSVQT